MASGKSTTLESEVVSGGTEVSSVNVRELTPLFGLPEYLSKIASADFGTKQDIVVRTVTTAIIFLNLLRLLEHCIELHPDFQNLT
jgi:hypothetical protein